MMLINRIASLLRTSFVVPRSGEKVQHAMCNAARDATADWAEQVQSYFKVFLITNESPIAQARPHSDWALVRATEQEFLIRRRSSDSESLIRMT